MADVAHLVRAPGCGSGGSGFNPHHSPQIYENNSLMGVIFLLAHWRIIDDVIGLLSLFEYRGNVFASKLNTLAWLQLSA